MVKANEIDKPLKEVIKQKFKDLTIDGGFKIDFKGFKKLVKRVNK